MKRLIKAITIVTCISIVMGFLVVWLPSKTINKLYSVKSSINKNSDYLKNNDVKYYVEGVLITSVGHFCKPKGLFVIKKNGNYYPVPNQDISKNGLLPDFSFSEDSIMWLFLVMFVLLIWLAYWLGDENNGSSSDMSTDLDIDINKPAEESDDINIINWD